MSCHRQVKISISRQRWIFLQYNISQITTIYVSAKPETLKKRGISKARAERDLYRIKVDFNSYDYVIPNNRSMSHLWDYVAFVAKKIREQELGIPNHAVK